MKKLVTIFLLAAMLMYGLGHYIVYKYNLAVVKHQMREAVSNGRFNTRELVSFIIDPLSPSTRADIEIVEDGKEIRFKGKMFDIVSVQFVQNCMVIKCLPDKNETAVLANFARYLQLQDGTAANGKKSIKLIKYSFPLFTASNAGVVAAKQPAFIPVNYFICLSAIIPNRYLNITSPPPWA